MKKNIIVIIVLVVFSVPAMIALFHAGFYQVHDNAQIPRVFEMAKALKNGMFPVRWVSDLGYGYGYPIFNFYSPFPYYIGALFILLGLNALVATKIMILIPVLASGVTMYFFIKNITDDVPAFCAALVYLYFPYHAVNIYIRGDMGELYSYALFPLIGLSLYKLWQFSTKKKYHMLWGIILSLSLAGVVISHNLSAYMMALFFTPAFLLGIATTKQKKIFIFSIIASSILAFLLVSFYMLPALSEMKYTNVTSQIGGGADYHDHFVCLGELWNSPWGYGGSAKGCTDGFSFKLGKSNVVFLALFLFYAAIFAKEFYRKNKKSFVLFIASAVGIVLSIFFMTSASTFVWQTLPQMAFLQYPWRFLNFAGFFVACILGLGIYLLQRKLGSTIAFLCMALIVLITLFSNAKLFSPQSFNSYPSSYYTNLSYIRWNVSKISDEYLPKNFQRPKTEQQVPKEKFAIIDGYGEIHSVIDQTNKISAQTVFASNAILKLNLAPFPAWSAFVDGKRIDTVPTSTGMKFIVPSGTHSVTFLYQSTPIEDLSNTVSIIGIICCIFAIIISIKWHYGSKKII